MRNHIAFISRTEIHYRVNGELVKYQIVQRPPKTKAQRRQERWYGKRAMFMREDEAALVRE